MIAHQRRTDSRRPVLGVWRTVRDIVQPPQSPEPDRTDASRVTR